MVVDGQRKSDSVLPQGYAARLKESRSGMCLPSASGCPRVGGESEGSGWTPEQLPPP